MALEFFLSEKDKLVVLSFRSDLLDVDQDQLENCLAETLELQPLAVAMQMVEVSVIQKGALRGFVHILLSLKRRGVHVLLAGLHPPLQQSLIQGGILSAGEIRPTLPEALKDLCAIVKAARGNAG